eukprot:352724-Chlamydomonas_euryale.AAC.8
MAYQTEHGLEDEASSLSKLRWPTRYHGRTEKGTLKPTSTQNKMLDKLEREIADRLLRCVRQDQYFLDVCAKISTS